MRQSKYVKYDTNYRNIMNKRRRERNKREIARKIGELYLRETKYKYIPIKTGALMRSTIMRLYSGFKNYIVELSSNTEYAEWVYDHAKIPWKRRWFEQVTKVGKNSREAERIMKEGMFK